MQLVHGKILTELLPNRIRDGHVAARSRVTKKLLTPDQINAPLAASPDDRAIYLVRVSSASPGRRARMTLPEAGWKLRFPNWEA